MKRRPPPISRRERGFTLVEVIVALMIIAMGLAALMLTVSSTARTSGYLRDKTLAQWIALNRLSEVRLNLTKFGQSTDTGELYFANRTWHYDTRYFDTTITTMRRVVVRVYAGNAKTKGNPIAESTGFLGGTVLAAPGSSNTADWTYVGTAVPGAGAAGATPATNSPTPANSPTPGSGAGTPTTPTRSPAPTLPAPSPPTPPN